MVDTSSVFRQVRLFCSAVQWVRCDRIFLKRCSCKVRCFVAQLVSLSCQTIVFNIQVRMRRSKVFATEMFMNFIFFVGAIFEEFTDRMFLVGRSLEHSIQEFFELSIDRSASTDCDVYMLIVILSPSLLPFSEASTLCKLPPSPTDNEYGLRQLNWRAACPRNDVLFCSKGHLLIHADVADVGTGGSNRATRIPMVRRLGKSSSTSRPTPKCRRRGLTFAACRRGRTPTRRRTTSTAR